MIGVLDSGVGGLAIYREIRKEFPNMKVIYFADTKNFPYGEKNNEELIVILRNAVKKLIANDVKIIILACNTATVAAISDLRKEFTVPFIGVEPAIKQASIHSKNGKIGVIATKRTICDHSNEKLIFEGQEIVKSEKAELVSLIENDFEEIDEVYLKNTLNDLNSKDVDSVVLGCTHYIFLKEKFEEIFPKISFYEPSKAIVNRLKEVTFENKITLTDGIDEFWVSEKPEDFTNKINKLLGKDVNVRRV